ncbi:MAG TPA: DUF6159 family protein, partial [Verrucomicrobiae bacterium]|nr:DUF6159 family protein [Verrucomicrobiae bacterium]
MNTILEKLQRSWLLFRRSVQVIFENPKLLVFPMVTFVLTSAIALFFLAPVAAVLLVPHWVEGGRIQAIADQVGFLRFQNQGSFNFQIRPLGTALLAGMYLVNMFLATMANVAFNSQIFEALNGRPVSIGGGIAVACRRWKQVLFWSLVAGVVGLVIRWLEERWSLVGRLVAGIIGLAWSTASIFAIPILAREDSVSNPFEVLTRSATTIKRTWGEMLAGYVGMQGTNLMVLWGSILFWVGTGVSALIFSNPWILLLGIPWLGLVIAYGYVTSIASRVYLCALFLYAA